MYDSDKITHAVIEFVDIAGLVKGASRGEGLGNKFLSHIRETDAILEVVRCFDDSNIIHVDGNVNPIRDIETINLERVSKLARNDKKYVQEEEIFRKIKEVLENGRPARSLEFDDEEKAIIKDAFLITMKPILYVANISEDDLGKEDNEYVKEVKKYALEEGNLAISLSVKVEEDLSTLEGDEEREMLEAYGLEESGLDTVVRASYDLLGLMSYLTAGKQECRAWTIKKGTKAPQAAGKIHTDFERGFIKAEIVSYNDLIENGTYQKAKESGLVRLEGKEYVMKDGDIVEFKFNV